MTKWAKIIIEIIKDIAIAFLINGTMISIPAAIQQKMTPDFNKFFGMVEMGVYEWIAVFLSSTALFLYFKRKQFGKYLDELTGRAKEEREYRKQLELANIESEEKLKLADIESKEKLELDTRKQRQEQVREAEEAQAKAQERTQLLTTLKDDLFFEENMDTKVIKNRKYWRVKAIERLKKFGFVVPSDEEQEYPNFDECWEDFLSKVIAVIECGSENEEGNFSLWEKFKYDLFPF